MLNWRLLTVQNIIRIGLMATAWHIALSPVFAKLSGRGGRKPAAQQAPADNVVHFGDAGAG